jgi:predicted nucleic acid-binding protein
MNILIDTNVLLDVAMDRKPFSASAADVLDAVQAGHFHGWIAWHTVSDLYYIFASGTNDSKARAFIRDLLTFVNVAGGDAESARRALSLDIPNFEDALQCVCALNCGAEAIVTRNVKDFRRSPVPSILPETLLSSIEE